jgi:hypothetical protein
MNPYELDIFLLSKFQKIGLWTRRIFGIKCSDWTIGIIVFDMMIDCMVERWRGLVIGFFWLWSVVVTVKNRGDNYEVEWNKPLALLRMFTIVLLIVGLPISRPDQVANNFAVVFVLYFYSCSDGPDIKSKLQEKIQSFKSSMSTGKLTPIRASN